VTPVVNRLSYGRTMRGLNTFFEKKINSLTAWKDKHFFKPLNNKNNENSSRRKSNRIDL
jgi:hypothetical protein